VRVKRLGYIGTRTSDVEGMTSFLRDVLGLEAAGEDETVTFQRLPTHRLDFIEVRMIPNGVDFMIAFVVDDIREARAEMEAAGLELVNELVWAAEAFGEPGLGDFAWFFVRAPDGRVYAIEQVPD